MLDGSRSRGSTPTDRLTFQWEQVSGPTAKPVFGQNTPRATYQAPGVGQGNVTLIFKLTAKNAKGAESSSQITVPIITPTTPCCKCRPDRTVRENTTVVFDGKRNSRS